MRSMLLVANLLAFGIAGCALDLDSLKGDRADADAPVSDSSVLDAPTDASMQSDGWVRPDSGSTGADGGGTSDQCGLVGNSCCDTGDPCQQGSCLRGVCTGFGGAYLSVTNCDSPCQGRNAYSAGCSCPSGFTAKPSVEVWGMCPNTGQLEPSTLTFCGAGQYGTQGAWGGVFVRDDGSGACVQAHPMTGGCSCPNGTQLVSLDVTLPASQGTLGVCVATNSPSVSFGGIYQSDDFGTCHANPLTGSCSCADGSTATTLGADVPIAVCTR